MTEIGPNFLENMQKSLKDGGGEFFVGGELTWADITVAHYVEAIREKFSADLVKKYPDIQAHLDRIWGLPKIKEWFTKRPVTDY